jgi:hypothetical protein
VPHSTPRRPEKLQVLLKATPSDTQPWPLPTNKPYRWATGPFSSKFTQFLPLLPSSFESVTLSLLVHTTMMKSLLILTTAWVLPCALALRPGLIRIPKEKAETALEKVFGADAAAGHEFGRLDKRRDSLKYVPVSIT